jgi:hypothetical protein
MSLVVYFYKKRKSKCLISECHTWSEHKFSDNFCAQPRYLIVNYGSSNDTPPWFIVAQAAFPEPWSDPPKNLTYLFANDDLLKIIYNVWWGWGWLAAVGATFWLLVIGVLLLCLDFVTAYVLGVPKLRRLRERDQKLKELWMQRHSSEE